MIILQIHHRTVYRYPAPVALGPHRLLLRPREGRDLRLHSFDLTINPAAAVTWAQDVFGNAVATAVFDGDADHLTIDAIAELQLEAEPWPIFPIAASAVSYPFRYSDDDWTDLGALAVQCYPDPDEHLRGWAQAFVRRYPTDTLSLLRDLSAGVASSTAYEARDVEGTQTPSETLRLARGSCRDFAVVFAEAARSLGFGARIVSGYLHNPDGASVGSSDAGSTHAWTEVYVPGAGWITFDPTNRSVGGANLVPVAVGRDIQQLMPVSGTFLGQTGGSTVMSVEVTVWPLEALSPTAT